jgi:hypothetical protein
VVKKLHGEMRRKRAADQSDGLDITNYSYNKVPKVLLDLHMELRTGDQETFRLHREEGLIWQHFFN